MIAAKVPEVTDEIRTLVQSMAETMYAAPGIGLAATQIDVRQRVIVIDTSDTHHQFQQNHPKSCDLKTDRLQS